MPPEIHLTEASPAWTAVVRERVAPADLCRFVPAACGEVWSFVRAPGMPRPGRNVALYGAQGLVEAGVEVAESFTGNERIHCSQLPAGRVAHVLHMGPYGRLRGAHAALASGVQPMGMNARASAGSFTVIGRRAGTPTPP